jgi:phosphate transport system protein
MDEQRRGYHDRIALIRDETIALVREAAATTGNVTAALIDHDLDASRDVITAADEGAALVAKVEDEIVELLALQAPVARDLRMILAALRIAQIAQLCLGLARTLAGRAGVAPGILTPPLRALIGAIGSDTAALLDAAGAAWGAVDEERAQAVIASAERCRARQREFLVELFGLAVAPVEPAVDLGMVARAYERLTDHAVEIAGRVVFAAGGLVSG